MKIRYTGLDFLKFVCAFLVVYIHSCSDSYANEYIIPITRIAVPVFFMITGFFYEETVNKNRRLEQIRKILKYILFSNLIYLVFAFTPTIVQTLLSHNSGLLSEKLSSVFSFQSLGNFIFFNESPFASHLWYLNSILYVLIIAMICTKFNIFRVLYIVTPLLLIADLLFGKYSIAVFGREFNIYYVRNFICVGLPYFVIGNVIYKLKHRLNKKTNILILTICFFILLGFAEKYILLHYGINATRDQYITTTPLAVSIFILFMQMQNVRYNWFNQVSLWGKNHSLIIYIIHPMIIFAIGIMQKILFLAEPLIKRTVSNKISLDIISPLSSVYLIPLIVFIISLIFSVIYKKLCTKFKNNIKQG